MGYWWQDPERPELGCFGSGYNSWGVQTNQKFLGAMAILATAPDVRESVLGMGRDEALDITLRALRFSLASHITGDHHCADGTKWGHTWISLLGVERMMHGIAALDEHMTDEDKADLRRVLVSEADAALNLPVLGTRWAADHGNRPESNIWNGAFLWRAWQMYPDAQGADNWIDKAHQFLVNGISIAADAEDEALVAGMPVKQWYVGPNFFDHYGLDHHGYFNVGYMVICLSNIAMLHFSCKELGIETPESLYHHAGDLWGLVKRLIFADGRLCRIGGDTRQRYCYCQDYLLPALLWAQDYLGDAHASALEAGVLELNRQEQNACANGSFLSQRLATMPELNPYYYTRLEADKAVVLSMNAYWRRTLEVSAPEPEESFEAAVGGSWGEPEHGAMFHRSPRRMASWSWRAAEPPQGLCLPPASGHLAEWCSNMGGSVRLTGETGKRKVVSHVQSIFDGGFLTSGTVADSEKAVLQEGWVSVDPAHHRYAVAALPDERTMVVLEYCRLGVRSYVSEIKGLKLNVPNDLFNRYRRTYLTDAGPTMMDGRGKQILRTGSKWANVENTIGIVGVYGADWVTIFQAGERRASGYADSLYYDEICYPCRIGTHAVDAGAVVLDCGSVVLSKATAEETAEFAAGGVEQLECGNTGFRAVRISGANGDNYVLVANFGDEEGLVTLDTRSDCAVDLASGEQIALTNCKIDVELAGGAAALMRV